MNRLLLLGLSSLALAPAARADTTIESGPARTHLLELFTSEGCSSCPPAEAWLSKLKDNPRLWQDFVPVAFHVDYWDRLGWRDPYASKESTARQYEYSARWKSESVYTPGFVLDGRELRLRSVPGRATESPGALKLSVTSDGTVRASFQPTGSNDRPLDLHLARLGFDLTTNVKAGENSGRKLAHDFVVLALTSEKLTTNRAELRLPDPGTPLASGARTALVAWVTEPGQVEPIQAAGGWLQ